jgi:2-haloacid dehalogenase/putative hydrolase of the HAD superfamily
MLYERFDLITFDCYGTLIDWEGGIVKAFQDEAARRGEQFDAGQIVAAYMAEERAVESSEYRPYRQVLDETAQRVFQRLGHEPDTVRAAFLSKSIGGWLPFPDTNAALERLARRFKLGILSNVDDDLLAATRRHFTVDFDLIVTAQQVKSYKPAHAHFEEARRLANRKRQLHAAQSYFHDVVPARALGVPVVWVNRNREAAAEGGPRPDYQVGDLSALADLLGV